MIGDRHVWHAALAMVRRFKGDAMLEAAQRADEVLEAGDMAGAETWHRMNNWHMRHAFIAGCKHLKRG